MKIVHICLCGPVTDGWNYQDNMLTKYHKKLGYDVTMITSQWIWGKDGKLEKINKLQYINSDDVKVVRLPIKGKDNFLRKFKRYEGLKDTLIRENPDILFIHNVSFIDIDTIVSYLKVHKKVKVFIDNHSDFSNSATNWISKNVLHKVIWRKIVNKIEPYTEKFYGVIPARVEFLNDIYRLPKEKTELLVMGADDEKIEEAKNEEVVTKIKTELNLNESDFVIITGGKIDEAKSQTLLLMEAVKKFKRNDIKLIIFGSVAESLKNKFMDLCDGNKIKYIGWINSNDSYKYFEIADLVVFPGRHSVFWEQVVAQGKPMICKYWKGTTHIDIGGNVKFLYQDNSIEIYNVIKEIIENERDYIKMKEISETMGSEEFSYKNIAKKSICMKVNNENKKF